MILCGEHSWISSRVPETTRPAGVEFAAVLLPAAFILMANRVLMALCGMWCVGS
jgi:hypothetical protein